MHLQKVQNRPLKTLQGIGVVAALLAVLLVLTFVTQLLIPLTGELVSSILFWGCGVFIALWTMRRYVLTFSYGLSASLLRVSYAYGRYERVMSDIYLNNILNAGALDDLRARYPNARVNRATRPTCPIAPLAIACKDDGRVAIYLLQPDEKIREVLMETAKKNRK